MSNENDEEVVFQTVVFCEEPGTATKRTYSDDGDHRPDADDPEDDGEPPIHRQRDGEIKVVKRPPRKLCNKYQFEENSTSGIKPSLVQDLCNSKPFDVFRTFLNDEFLQEIVDTTNQYAAICQENNQLINTWIQPWRNTNIDEMKKFIGIVIWMGLVKYPTLNSYWCRSYLYTNKVMQAMSRSQFQLITNMWRFTSGDERSLSKDNSIFEMLRKKFQDVLEPPELFSVERTFIPYDLDQEGVNLLSLTLKGGYIYDFSLKCGTMIRAEDHPDILSVAEDLLDRGRKLVLNEDLNSIALAKRLIQRKTHLIGTLDPSDRQIPSSLRQFRVNGNEVHRAVTTAGLTIYKFNPFSEQYLLTTLRRTNLKEYYKLRSFTAVSSELKVNNQILLNNLNWYQKLGIEVIINMCLVNACYLYRKVCTKKISSIRFLEDIVSSLLDLPVNVRPSTQKLGKLGGEAIFEMGREHILKRLTKSKRCVSCYDRMCSEFGRKMGMNRAQKSHYECNACNKVFCVDCFFKFHSGKLKNVI